MGDQEMDVRERERERKKERKKERKRERERERERETCWQKRARAKAKRIRQPVRRVSESATRTQRHNSNIDADHREYLVQSGEGFPPE
jgi:hypothetical protein